MKVPHGGEDFGCIYKYFLSYLLVAAIITVLAGVAIFVGIKLRKNKDKQLKSE